MVRASILAPSIFLLSLSLALGGCSGERPIVDGVVQGEITGSIYKGVVDGADLALLVEGESGWSLLGEGVSDAEGRFTFDVGTELGHLRIEATGGHYVEEASGVEASLAHHRLELDLGWFDAGEERAGVVVTPVTTLAAAYARWRHHRWSEAPELALEKAERDINEHFGELAWGSVVPSDPTSVPAQVVTEDLRAGLLLAGLSQLARTIAERQGYLASDLTTAELTTLLAEDIEADGQFNGVGFTAAPLEALGHPLDGQTLRHQYAKAVIAFLVSERNATVIGRADVDAMVTFINGNTSEIFPASDPPLPLDLNNPIIEFLEPAPGSGARGTVFISARATDAGSGIQALGFVAPLELVSTAPVGLGQPTASIEATLDVSPLDDGPLEIILRAEDGDQNWVETALQLTVTNNTPDVVVESPPRDASVQGQIEIVASASPNPSTGSPIVRLELLPTSNFPDLDATAMGLRVIWNTSLAPEGPMELVFFAKDALDSSLTLRHPVVVDNRPAPVVGGVALMAGHPVQGALVEVLTIEQAGSRIVGTGVTSALGTFSVTLTDENVSTPIALVVRGQPGATYHNLVAQQSTVFPDPNKLSAFAPSVATANDLLVSPWTTLADALARGYHLDNQMIPEDAYDLAEEMISGHFKRPAGWPALASSRPPDLSVPGNETVDSARLALADAGLLFLAQDLSLRVSGDPLAHPVTGAIDLLYLDLEDQVFDGLVGGMPIPPFGDTTLDAEPTRAYLAMGIRGFLESPANQSGLTLAAVLADGLLDHVANDSRSIYPSDGTTFDLVGPTITWNHPPEGFDAGDATLTASATATDSSGVLDLVIDGFSATDTNSADDQVEVQIDNTVVTGTLGSVTLRALARDRFGNETESLRTFTRPPASMTLQAVDPTAPLIPLAFVTGPFDLDATAHGGFATAQFFVEESGWPANFLGQDRGGSVDKILRRVNTDLLTNDGLLSIQAQHTTVDGDIGVDTLEVVLDRSAPTLTGAPLGGTLSTGKRWYGPSTPEGTTANVSVDCVAGDPTTSLVLIELSATGIADDGTPISIPPVSLSPGQTTFMGALELTLPQGVYDLNLRAVDEAGNEALAGPWEVWVDTTPPTLVDASGTFDDEALLDFVWQNGAGVYVPRNGHLPRDISLATIAEQQWSKMEQRLSGLTELDAQVENLPRFQVEASDPGQSIFSDVGSMRVESFYEVEISAGIWEAPPGRGWQAALPVLIPGSFPATHLELASLERLGPNLQENDRSHRVTLRAIDDSGNFSQAITYSFRFEILPAPVAVEIDLDYRTTSVNDPRSLYHYSFGNQNIHELFATTPPAAFTLGGPHIARAIIHQPWSFPVRVWLDTTAASTISLSKSSGTKFVKGPVHQHDCGTPSIMPGCDLAQPAGEPNTPCLTSWDDPSRFNVYRLNASGDPNGAMMECRCDGAPCSGIQVQPKSSETVQLDPRNITPEFHILDGSGAAVSRTAPNPWELPTGDYELIMVATLPTNMPFTHTTITSTFAGRSAYGVVLESRETHVTGSDVALTVGTPIPKFGTCVSMSTCTSYATQEEKLVVGDFEANFAPPDGSARILLNLLTLSSLETGLPARDPDLGLDPSTTPFFPLSAVHFTDETEL